MNFKGPKNWNFVSYICVYSCLILIFFDFGHGLLQLVAKNNDTVRTEVVIRNTINSLFQILNISKTSGKPHHYDGNALHIHLMGQFLEGNGILNQIVRVAKVDRDEKAAFVDTINNVLEDENENGDSQAANVSNINDVDMAVFTNKLLKDIELLSQEFNIDKDQGDSDAKLKTNASMKEINFNESKENDDVTDEIWEPSGRRIYKGFRTKIKHFPFMAVIQIFKRFHCAGSIIKSDLIITASSCLQLAWNNRLFRENPAFLSVRVGSSFYNGGGDVISILEVYFHPGYTPKTLRNNICILRLSRHIKFRKRSRKVKRIDFDRHASKLPYNTAGITVVGWGAKEHNPVVGNPWKNIISYDILHYYPLEECQEVYSREYVTNKNFCAGFMSKGGGACNHDVGGPGVVDGKLMGVISFGAPVCGSPDSPTVFTKLGYYTDWIEEIMEQDVPTSKKRTTLKSIYEIETFKYTPSKPTTFKIAPITGKTMTPIPISQIDSQLRMLDDNALKEFLDTVLTSKEMKAYKDILKDDNNLLLHDDTKKDVNTEFVDEINSVTEHQDVQGPYTEIQDASANNENDKMHIDTAYTIMELENDHMGDYDNEMSKVIDKDVERIDKEEVFATPDVGNGTKHSAVNLISSKESETFYPLENENIIDVVSDDTNKHTDDDDVDGLSIPDDIFKDMTRAKNNEEGVLPESVLYELLTEVIRDEVKNISLNSFGYFISYF